METPPIEDAEVLPPTPTLLAPNVNPTCLHDEHCLNCIRLPTIMRYPGLRIGQAAAIHREHLDLEDHAPHVATGKSRREKAAVRTVPVSPHLLDDLGPWLATLPDRGPLFRGADPAVPMPSPRNQTRYVTQAWKQATADKVVKQAVWLPRNRKQARPDRGQSNPAGTSRARRTRRSGCPPCRMAEFASSSSAPGAMGPPPWT